MTLEPCSIGQLQSVGHLFTHDLRQAASVQRVGEAVLAERSLGQLLEVRIVAVPLLELPGLDEDQQVTSDEPHFRVLVLFNFKPAGVARDGLKRLL